MPIHGPPLCLPLPCARMPPPPAPMTSQNSALANFNQCKLIPCYDKDHMQPPWASTHSCTGPADTWGGTSRVCGTFVTLPGRHKGVGLAQCILRIALPESEINRVHERVEQSVDQSGGEGFSLWLLFSKDPLPICFGRTTSLFIAYTSCFPSGSDNGCSRHSFLPSVFRNTQLKLLPFVWK